MRFFRLIRAVLREIFDEAAYERFCLREELPAGRMSYSKFLDQTAASGNKKVRCC
jgi:hypothetical protein